MRQHPRLRTLVAAALTSFALAVAPAGAAQGTTTQKKPAAPSTTKAATPVTPPAVVESRIELNTATKEQLMTLPGITEAIALKIVAGRPYKKKSDIKSKIIPDAVYNKISEKIFAKNPANVANVAKDAKDAKDKDAKDKKK